MTKGTKVGVSTVRVTKAVDYLIVPRANVMVDTTCDIKLFGLYSVRWLFMSSILSKQ